MGGGGNGLARGLTQARTAGLRGRLRAARVPNPVPPRSKAQRTGTAPLEPHPHDHMRVWERVQGKGKGKWREANGRRHPQTPTQASCPPPPFPVLKGPSGELVSWCLRACPGQGPRGMGLRRQPLQPGAEGGGAPPPPRPLVFGTVLRLATNRPHRCPALCRGVRRGVGVPNGRPGRGTRGVRGTDRGGRDRLLVKGRPP